ncbi:helix-turn-helix transcriptional regulator [[Clostridium] innocuum]|nr:helix-turn-helix transcriptional regulator [[Clostridium] innocuum]MCR0526193.1 helix-turn-helix transcriptional regulator [[Clostridium] innocuum]MCR0626198.1 helix-turn-helix transcriptional regulator [[Clostridium] innocuum]
MEDIQYGSIKIHLDELMKEQQLSLNKLSFRAEMQRTQLRKYYKNDIQRLDVAVLTRLCYALDCKIEDLIEYIPPEK